MKNVILNQDVLTSEMDTLLGGSQDWTIRVKVTRADGTTYEVEVEV